LLITVRPVIPNTFHDNYDDKNDSLIVSACYYNHPKPNNWPIIIWKILFIA